VKEKQVVSKVETEENVPNQHIKGTLFSVLIMGVIGVLSWVMMFWFYLARE
jgi:hypothetical protein